MYYEVLLVLAFKYHIHDTNVITINVYDSISFLEMFFNTLLIVRSHPDIFPIGSCLMILMIYPGDMGLVRSVIGKGDERHFWTLFV